MNSTQQITDITGTELTACLRIGQMFDADGKLFYFELDSLKIAGGYKVALTIFENEHKSTNIIFEKVVKPLCLEAAREQWTVFNVYLRSTFTLNRYETFKYFAGQPSTEELWEAEPKGSVVESDTFYHDANEGSYIVAVNFKELTLTYGGTSCPDVPMDMTTEKFLTLAALEVALVKRLRGTNKNWYAMETTRRFENFVTVTERSPFAPVRI